MMSKAINRFLVALAVVLHVGILGVRKYQIWKHCQDRTQIFIIFKSVPGNDNGHEDGSDGHAFTVGAAIFASIVFAAAFFFHSRSRYL